MEGTYGYCIMLNVHTCTYIHGLHTYTPIHIYMYICVHIYVWVYIYMCVCVHIYTYMYSWASGRTAAHHPWACLCRRGYACTHTNLHVYTHTTIYAHVHAVQCATVGWCRRNSQSMSLYDINSQSTTGSDQNATASQTQCEVHIQSGWLAGKLFNKLLHITYGQI